MHLLISTQAAPEWRAACPSSLAVSALVSHLPHAWGCAESVPRCVCEARCLCPRLAQGHMMRLPTSICKGPLRQVQPRLVPMSAALPKGRKPWARLLYCRGNTLHTTSHKFPAGATCVCARLEHILAARRTRASVPAAKVRRAHGREYFGAAAWRFAAARCKHCGDLSNNLGLFSFSSSGQSSEPRAPGHPPNGPQRHRHTEAAALKDAGPAQKRGDELRSPNPRPRDNVRGRSKRESAGTRCRGVVTLAALHASVPPAGPGQCPGGPRSGGPQAAGSGVLRAVVWPSSQTKFR
jgi:hypothetical protein